MNVLLAVLWLVATDAKPVAGGERMLPRTVDRTTRLVHDGRGAGAGRESCITCPRQMKLRFMAQADADIIDSYIYGFETFGRDQAERYEEGLRDAAQPAYSGRVTSPSKLETTRPPGRLVGL